LTRKFPEKKPEVLPLIQYFQWLLVGLLFYLLIAAIVVVVIVIVIMLSYESVNVLYASIF
jgi:hypothetical protein